MTLTKLERISSQTFLGIRFWDAIGARPIAEGLKVTAQRLSADKTKRLGRLVVGRALPSGIIAFFGLSRQEKLKANVESQLWDVLPAAQDVVVDVEDLLGRYLPMSFFVQIPKRQAWRGREGNLVLS